MPALADGPVQPGSWDALVHFYPRVPNAVMHPLVRSFFHLGNTRIAERYAHLHPEVDRAAVHALLGGLPQWFRWSGTDLFHTTDEHGVRRMVVIETNSSPSGQKSMPLLDEADEQSGYRRLLSRSFLPLLQQRGLPSGVLAVLWDKNPMEVSGYASVLADLTGEPVHLVHLPAEGGALRVTDGVVQVPVDGAWTPVQAAFRYVTQRPWVHLPPITRTAMQNPVLACLAGGRNKLVAAKAYALFNARHADVGLRIRTPHTNPSVSYEEVPLALERLGGVGVVKVPYGNAGQGIYTITCEQELRAFQAVAHRYERFVVQALIGNVGWSSRTREGRLYHVGTMPDQRSEMYVADVRMMVGADADGFYPVAMYARRARAPLSWERPTDGTSWNVLGTNLSKRVGEGEWTTEPERVLLVDSRDFNSLGVGIDDLIEAYVQSVMATSAIDAMAAALVDNTGAFRRGFFRSIDSDATLLEEMAR